MTLLVFQVILRQQKLIQIQEEKIHELTGHNQDKKETGRLTQSDCEKAGKVPELTETQDDRVPGSPGDSALDDA